jgi:tripartite-type tricarboxylate transporter receptor subunit TctC
MRRLAAVALMALLLAAEARAQGFPTAPFRIFVPFGGGIDQPSCRPGGR